MILSLFKATSLLCTSPTCISQLSWLSGWSLAKSSCWKESFAKHTNRSPSGVLVQYKVWQMSKAGTLLHSSTGRLSYLNIWICMRFQISKLKRKKKSFFLFWFCFLILFFVFFVFFSILNVCMLSIQFPQTVQASINGPQKSTESFHIFLKFNFLMSSSSRRVNFNLFLLSVCLFVCLLFII